MSISDNIKRIVDELNEEVEKAGREKGSVELCAVAKTKSIEKVRDALSAGVNLKHIGENYLQEIMAKYPLDEKRTFTLHMIGHLQTNKVKHIVPYIDTIDSIDSLKVLDMVNTTALALGKKVEILIELNTAFDGYKTGFMSDDEALRALDGIEDKNGVILKGFMTMGQLDGTESQVRASFAHLRQFRDKCQKEHPTIKMDTLSMGMSSDWKYAIKEGSTIVRIGTAIFGEREYNIKL